MTAVVPVYRCGAAPDFHRVPSCRSGWPEHQREVNITECKIRVKPPGAVHESVRSKAISATAPESATGIECRSVLSSRVLYSTFLLIAVPFVAVQGAEGEPAKREKEVPVPESAAPEDTRAERWKQKRIEKRSRVTPPRASGFEKALLWVEKRGLGVSRDAGSAGVHPVVGVLGPRSGVAFGARFWQPDLGRSRLDVALTGGYSIRGYQLYDLQFGRIRDFGPGFELGPEDYGFRQRTEPRNSTERLSVFGRVRYHNFTRQNYFGPGPDSREEDRTDYRLEEVFYGKTVHYRASTWLQGEWEVGLLQVNTGPGTDPGAVPIGSVFDDATAPGLAHQPGFFRTRATLTVDFRDRPENTHSGGVVDLSWSRHTQVGGDDYHFSGFAVQARQYLPLGSRQRVLALRFLTSTTRPEIGSRVPFYFRPTLGSPHILRASRDQRFRDRNLIYLSAEYRWEAAPALELALFYEAGKVFRNRSDFDLMGLRKNVGFGFRFKSRDRVLIRVDLARGREDTRVRVTVGPAF